MTTDEYWQAARRHLGLPDTKEARLAFQAGVRHGLNVLTDSLDDADETLARALKLNDEILAFARSAVATS